MSEEATINPDGSTTFADAGADAGATDETFAGEETFEEAFAEGADSAEAVREGTDPAIFLALAFIGAVILYYFNYQRTKKKQMEREAFFYDMDGDKVRRLLQSIICWVRPSSRWVRPFVNSWSARKQSCLSDRPFHVMEDRVLL